MSASGAQPILETVPAASLVAGGAWTWKTLQASATGATALWTPAAGKRWRLMRLALVLPPNATLAARGVLVVSLLDVAAATGLAFDAFVGQTAAVETASAIPTPLLATGMMDLGGGILAAAVNTALNVNLSAALTAGAVRVVAGGVEE